MALPKVRTSLSGCSLNDQSPDRGPHPTVDPSVRLSLDRIRVPRLSARSWTAIGAAAVALLLLLSRIFQNARERIDLSPATEQFHDLQVQLHARQNRRERLVHAAITRSGLGPYVVGSDADMAIDVPVDAEGEVALQSASD